MCASICLLLDKSADPIQKGVDLALRALLERLDSIQLAT